MRALAGNAHLGLHAFGRLQIDSSAPSNSSPIIHQVDSILRQPDAGIACRLTSLLVPASSQRRRHRQLGAGLERAAPASPLAAPVALPKTSRGAMVFSSSLDLFLSLCSVPAQFPTPDFFTYGGWRAGG